MEAERDILGLKPQGCPYLTLGKPCLLPLFLLPESSQNLCFLTYQVLQTVAGMLECIIRVN